jgi:hypothetical protein
MRGTEVVIFTYKDGKISRRPAAFGNAFTFNPDGSFHMYDWSGTWTQSGSAFTIDLSYEDIKRYFEFHFGRLGYTVEVTDVSTLLTGKENMNDTISGKHALAMDLSHDYNDVPIKITLDSTFTGRRVQETPASTVKGGPLKGAKSLIEAIGTELNQTIQE